MASLSSTLATASAEKIEVHADGVKCDNRSPTNGRNKAHHVATHLVARRLVAVQRPRRTARLRDVNAIRPFAQSASEALSRDFPGRDISFPLLTRTPVTFWPRAGTIRDAPDLRGVAS